MSARTTAEIVVALRGSAQAREAWPSQPYAAKLEREAADRLEALEAAALHACDTPDCPAITYRCAESRPA